MTDIANAFTDHFTAELGCPVIVTKWVAVIEYVTPDGTFRTMATRGSDELSDWDACGMYEMAAAGYKARYAAMAIEGDED